MKIIKYAAFLVLGIIAITRANGQYISENPAYSKRESSTFTLKKVTVYPDKIWLEAQYINYADNPTIQISDQTSIRLPDLSNKTYRVTNRRNVNSTMTPITSGKYVTFFVGFSVPLFKLLDEELKKQKHMLEFFEKGELTLDFLDCTDEYRRANNVEYGNCWNYYGVLVKLDVSNWNALYCYGYLENLMQKDEFETTTEYSNRTTPDALKASLKSKIMDFENTCIQAFIYSITKKKPELTYNADEQVFTIKYQGAEPAKIKMPGADARAFKEGVLNGSIVLSFGDVEKNMIGNYVFENFYFKNGAKETTYSNILSDAEEARRLSFRNFKRVEDEVKSLQREIGSKAKID